jgi:hypothetical protein
VSRGAKRDGTPRFPHSSEEHLFAQVPCSVRFDKQMWSVASCRKAAIGQQGTGTFWLIDFHHYYRSPPFLQILLRSREPHFSVRHDRELCCDLFHFGQQMTREEHGHAATARQTLNQSTYLMNSIGIKSVSWVRPAQVVLDRLTRPARSQVAAASLMNSS